MGFVVCEPGEFRWSDALPEGWASLDKNGTLLCHSGDLAIVELKDRAVVMYDSSTWRLGLRKPRSGEDSKATRISSVMRGKTDTRRRRINCGRAIRALALTTVATRGRYELKTKDDLLIVHLADDELGGKGAK